MPRTNLNSVRDLGAIKAADINGIGEAQGRAFSKNVKTSQLRAFYSAVNRIRVQFQRANDFSPEIERSLILLKPKLAYAAGRHPRQLRDFRNFMERAIDGVVGSNGKVQALTNFFDLLEAVVAYHKFHGGRDN